MVWDERFAGDDYLFGTAPAAAVPRLAGHLPPRAHILSLAEGEGRNGVWLAGQGHRVTGIEPSANARRKAEALALGQGGKDFSILDGDVTQPLPPAAADGTPWDAVMGIFIQFLPPAARGRLHRRIADLLPSGALLILHGYAPRQVLNGTGGPPRAENLYTLEGLAADFPGWHVLEQADYDVDINEGRAHSGRSALVDFVARKP